ncbi:response regulator [Candidatus Nitrospira bockiana]
MPKILVADDSITVRKVAERLLTEAGMEVALAASGEEAMAYLTTEHPDFIISDVIMPDKSGYDVCRFVRSQAALADTPVLLISGIVNDEVNRQAESCRANGVLKKPFQGTSLQERVRELMAKQCEPGAETGSQPQEEPRAPVHGPHASEDISSTGTAARKAYKITEDQLQSFREAAGRIKELERLLDEERARSSQLAAQLETGSSNSRSGELEAQLTEYQRRLETLTVDHARIADLEQRNRELETLVAELRRAMPEPHGDVPPHGGHATVAELQALLADQQQRLSELTNEILKHGEAGERVAALEAALSEERGRAKEAMRRCEDAEQAWTNANAQVRDLTESLMNANARVDGLRDVLSKISRLAAAPENDDTRLIG